MNHQKKIKLTFNRIVDFVCDYYNIPDKEILNRNRKKDVVRARQIIIYLVRERLNKSYPVIGKKLGGRDHTTMLYAYNKIKKEIEEDKRIKEDVGNIMALIINRLGVSFEAKKRNKNIVSFRRKERMSRQKKVRKQNKKNYPTIIRSIKDLPSLNLEPELLIRQNNILQMYKEGFTLEEIGKEHGVTRERIRQIVNKGLIYSLREVLEHGIELNLEEFLREEKRKHLLATRKKQGIIRKKIIKKEKRWARSYDYCRECGTIVIKHHSHGLCKKCYPKTQIYKEQQESSRLRNIKKRSEHTKEYSKEYFKRPEVIIKQKEYSKRSEVVERRRKEYDLKYFSGNREKTIIRDKERCRDCGLSREENYKKYNEDFRVIHINDKKDNSLDNLLTLCKKCFYKELRQRRN